MRRLRFGLLIALALGPACSRPPEPPVRPSATLIVRAPSQVTVRVCAECSNGELEVAADLIVEETAGVGGTITGIVVTLRNGSVVLAGPGQYNGANVATFAGGTNRVGPRGSLTVRNVAMHFAATFRAQLPAVYSFNIVFTDDNGNTVTADATTQAVP